MKRKMKKSTSSIILALLGAAMMAGCGKTEEVNVQLDEAEVIEVEKTEPEATVQEETEPETTNQETTNQEEKEEVEDVTEDVAEDVTAEVEEPAGEEQAVTYNKQEVNEIIYAHSSANIRKGPGTEYDIAGSVNWGDELVRTGILDNGWSEIVYQDEVCYVHNSLIGLEKPAAQETAPIATASQQSGTGDTKTLLGKLRYQVFTTPNGVKIWTLKTDSCGWNDYILNAIDSAGITNEMSEYEKCVSINNYICSIVEYAELGSDPDGTPFNKSIHSDYCLITGRAACGGYADAFQSMCVAVGIECWLCSGFADNGGYDGQHAWNYVIADGTGYYVDVCWNDGLNNAYLMSTTPWDNHIEGARN